MCGAVRRRSRREASSQPSTACPARTATVGWVCDASLVAPAVAAAAAYIEDLVGDLATNSERYGVVDRDSGDFEFVPDWFLAPREEALAAARRLAHTQMLCSFVAERRGDSSSG